MNLSRPLRVLALICVASLSTPLQAAEQPHEISDHSACAPDGIALGGYDVVSYHDGGPERGTERHALRHGELTYHFASEANRARFVAAPDSYLPRYRGWCSATLSMGRLACPDFTNYKIEDGQLLLFERIGFSNGLDMWNADPITAKTNADGHFKRLLDEAQNTTAK